jgi:hypothetical protein
LGIEPADGYAGVKLLARLRQGSRGRLCIEQRSGWMAPLPLSLAGLMSP